MWAWADVGGESSIRLNCAHVGAIDRYLRAGHSLPDRDRSAENDLLLQLKEKLCLLVCQHLRRLNHTLELRFFYSHTVSARLQHLQQQRSCLTRAPILTIVDIDKGTAFAALDEERSRFGTHCAGRSKRCPEDRRLGRLGPERLNCCTHPVHAQVAIHGNSQNQRDRDRRGQFQSAPISGALAPDFSPREVRPHPLAIEDVLVDTIPYF